MRALTSRVLDWFNGWFASGAGVWQTFGISVLVTVVELVFPHLDPNGFRWLYLCTVWSFFTQNALAYSSNRDAAQVVDALKQILVEVGRIEDDEIQVLDRLGTKGGRRK